eukprot:g18689.t1
MGPVDVQPSAAVAAGGGRISKFPQRKLSGDLKLRLARLPSLGAEGGGGDVGKSRHGGACSSRRASTDGIGTHRSGAASVYSSRKGYPGRERDGSNDTSGGRNGGGGGAGGVRRLSLTSARDGFSLVPTTGSVAVNGGVDSSRLNWTNPLSERGGIGGDGRRTYRSGGGTTARSLGRNGVGESSGGAGIRGGGGGSEGGEGDDGAHIEFMKELASQNGLQLRCSQGEDERARHQREVQRRIEIQEKCIQRPSVGQSKSLLKAKILGSIGGGPFELLRAFRKMHCGRGTVIDVHDFREAVKKLSLGLTEEEILDFFRSFDADGSGGIDFNEFCEWVGSIHEGGDGDGGGSGKGGFRPSSADSVKSVSKRKMRDAQARVKAASEKVPLRTMKENEQLLREKILGSIGGGPFQLLRAFRKMHRGSGTVVDLNDFREAVTTFSLGLGEPEVVAFFKGFDTDGSGGIDFEEFCTWVGGTDASGEAEEQCLIPESKPTTTGRGGAAENEGMTPAQKAQKKVSRAFREQAGKMSSETLHKVLREKLISTVKPGGGTLLRTYHNLHRSGNVGGVELGDFKEAVHRYGMGVTDAQVEKLFRRYDKDGSGDIDFHEFLKLIMYAEDLAPEEERSAPANHGPQAGNGGEGGDIRPLSPGWAARVAGETDKQGRKGGDGTKETAAKKGELAARDADGGGGGGVADGVAPGARCSDGAPAERRVGSLTFESVLGSSPVTKGAKAEEKIKACVRTRWRHMLTAFRRYDPPRTGTVTFEEFQQVLKTHKAMQSLGEGDVTALATKHAAPRGRVDYPRFMRQLMLSSDLAEARRGPGGRRAGQEAQRGPAVDGDGGLDVARRPSSAAQRRSTAAGLGGSKSTGALGVACPSPPRRSEHQIQLRPIGGPTSRGGGGGGSGGQSELRDRATSICRELQPHIMRVWKPLWKDLKAADQSSAAAASRGGGGGVYGGPGTWSRVGPSRATGTTPYHAVSSGEIETHLFSSILARHGLELSNRDLMSLEHLPATAHKGWALPGAGLGLSSSSSSSSTPLAVATSSAAQSENRRAVVGNGRIHYDSFLASCLMSPVR